MYREEETDSETEELTTEEKAVNDFIDRTASSDKFELFSIAGYGELDNDNANILDLAFIGCAPDGMGGFIYIKSSKLHDSFIERALRNFPQLKPAQEPDVILLYLVDQMNANLAWLAVGDTVVLNLTDSVLEALYGLCESDESKSDFFRAVENAKKALNDAHFADSQEAIRVFLASKEAERNSLTVTPKSVSSMLLGLRGGGDDKVREDALAGGASAFTVCRVDERDKGSTDPAVALTTSPGSSYRSL